MKNLEKLAKVKIQGHRDERSQKLESWKSGSENPKVDGFKEMEENPRNSKPTSGREFVKETKGASQSSKASQGNIVGDTNF